MLAETSIAIEVKAWSRDSPELYDYEDQSIPAISFEVAVPGLLVLNQDNVRFLTSDQSPSVDDKRLMLVGWSEGQCVVKPSEGSDLWQVVNQMPERCVRLEKNMQLKLGRVRYCVKEIVTTPEDCEIYFEAAHPEEETSAQDLAESICKICYDKETEQQNPLLSLCQCESDEKFTHFLCLKQWLRSKVKQKNTDTSITYQWKSLECENCGTELPLSFWHRGSHFSLLDAEHPQCPHIVLEAFPLEDNLKCVHIIFIKTKTEITLGRAPDSDVRIMDISLSRLHATIKYADGIFSLFDNDSKFGTLIQVLAPLQLTSSITLQAGKSLIHVETRDRTAEIRSGGEEVTNS